MEKDPAKGTETIILAEDYEMLRGVTRVLLESYGYRVIEAKDGRDALEVFGRDPDAVDLVMLDVTMPNMDGREAYEKMATIKPGLKVLFTSGSNEEAASLGGMVFVKKPSPPDMLVRKIRELLDT